jgi:hypothetical protein
LGKNFKRKARRFIGLSSEKRDAAVSEAHAYIAKLLEKFREGLLDEAHRETNLLKIFTEYRGIKVGSVFDE